MRKLTLLAAVLFLFGGIAFAQTATTVTGSVTDTTNKKKVSNAVVALLTPKDSVFHRFGRTDAAGNFTLKNVKPGKYTLLITQPLFADYVDDIDVPASGLSLKELPITPKSKLLQEVIVKSGGFMRIKGDTVSYTADSFKVSANANVEELLKKLPGIQVDRNGQIKAMGETVEKVLVDGEEFFGDDPGMAVKNLRADAVKEVQVFDKKSEQAEFTGIDDGKTQKTINLKLKEDKKRGYFGKVDLSGGLQDKIDHRYNNNVMINAFKGKRKMAAYLLQGNTGQDGLNWEDERKFGGEDENVSFGMDDDGGFVSMWRGGNEDEPYIDTRNGFIENLNIGGQYTNKWNDKRTLNFSPKFNRRQYSNTVTTLGQLQFGDSLFNDNGMQNTYAYNRNIKNNISYDMKLDSANSLKITARANFYDNKSTVYTTSTNTSKSGIVNNSRTQLDENNTDKQTYSTSIIFKHKFKKDRRTLSVNTDIALQNKDYKGSLFSNNILNIGGILVPQVVDQQKSNISQNKKITTTVAYTEPLTKKYSLELNYELSYSKGENTYNTFSQTVPGSGKYDFLVDSLTNNFNQAISTNRVGFKVSYKDKKFKYNLGTGVGYTHFDLEDVTINKGYTRSFTNLFPAASLTYTYKPNSNIRVNYYGRTRQPSIGQLQQLRNNNNPLSEYIGNPLLKQSFSHNVSFSHNTYNFLKELWMYQSVNLSTTSNNITNSITIESNGKTITKPINTNGNYNISSWMGMGKKLKKLDLYLNLNLSFNYNQFVDVVNNRQNKTNNAGTSIGFGISKSKDKKYDFSIRDDFGFNSNKSSVTTRPTVRYNTNTLYLDAGLYIKKVWRISSDLEYNYRQQTQDFATNVNNTLWNARLQRSFKKDEFTLYVLIRDILNQNIGVDRNLSGNGFTEVRNERLRQYWMVGFKWDFKNKAAAKK